MSEEDRIVNEILEKNGRIKLARKVYKLENIIKEVREYLKFLKKHYKELKPFVEEIERIIKYELTIWN